MGEVGTVRGRDFSFIMSLQLLYRFKMILAGEPGSGKTSLFHRIIYSNSKGAEQANTSSNEEASFGSGYKNCTKEVKLSGNNKVNVRFTRL